MVSWVIDRSFFTLFFLSSLGSINLFISPPEAWADEPNRTFANCEVLAFTKPQVFAPRVGPLEIPGRISVMAPEVRLVDQCTSSCSATALTMNLETLLRQTTGQAIDLSTSYFQMLGFLQEFIARLERGLLVTQTLDFYAFHRVIAANGVMLESDFPHNSNINTPWIVSELGAIAWRTLGHLEEPGVRARAIAEAKQVLEFAYGRPFPTAIQLAQNIALRDRLAARSGLTSLTLLEDYPLIEVNNPIYDPRINGYLERRRGVLAEITARLASGKPLLISYIHYFSLFDADRARYAEIPNEFSPRGLKLAHHLANIVGIIADEAGVPTHFWIRNSHASAPDLFMPLSYFWRAANEVTLNDWSILQR